MSCEENAASGRRFRRNPSGGSGKSKSRLFGALSTRTAFHRVRKNTDVATAKATINVDSVVARPIEVIGRLVAYCLLIARTIKSASLTGDICHRTNRLKLATVPAEALDRHAWRWKPHFSARRRRWYPDRCGRNALRPDCCIPICVPLFVP